MESVISEEGDAPTTAGSTRTTVTKLAALWFRIHGLLDRLLTVAKHLAALITRMESRIPRGPPDYEVGARPPWVTVNYEGGPAPTQEPSWQEYLTRIVAILIASGLGGLIWVLSAMNGRLSTIEANQTGGTKLMIQRLDEQEKHLEAHDKQLDELNREVWPHKH